MLKAKNLLIWAMFKTIGYVKFEPENFWAIWSQAAVKK